MAQRGYTTATEAELLRQLGWQFDPDLVLVQFFINDALPSGDNFTHVAGSWLLPRVNLLPVRFRSGSIQRSAIFFLIESQLSSQVNRWRKRGWDSLYRDEAEGWEQLTRGRRPSGLGSRPLLYQGARGLETVVGNTLRLPSGSPRPRQGGRGRGWPRRRSA